MLVLVPEPVWNTSTGNCACQRPSNTSSADCIIASALFLGSKPRFKLVSAAQYLINATARIKAKGSFTSLILKLSMARCVCAPYNASAGTCTSPKLSFSILNSVMIFSLANKPYLYGDEDC